MLRPTSVCARCDAKYTTDNTNILRFKNLTNISAFLVKFDISQVLIA